VRDWIQRIVGILNVQDVATIAFLSQLLWAAAFTALQFSMLRERLHSNPLKTDAMAYAVGITLYVNVQSREQG
jgi:hypothetical protein